MSDISALSLLITGETVWSQLRCRKWNCWGKVQGTGKILKSLINYVLNTRYWVHYCALLVNAAQCNAQLLYSDSVTRILLLTVFFIFSVVLTIVVW